jgi:hypothetical protein
MIPFAPNPVSCGSSARADANGLVAHEPVVLLRRSLEGSGIAHATSRELGLV